MAEGKFVAYYRVSTEKQGRSGLGLDAQREAVAGYLNGGAWQLIGEFTETESGARGNRPALTEALALAKKQKATLIVAKMDRLSRSVAFIAGLMEANVDFVAVDQPHANKLTIHILSAVAEHEREMISQRTKAALRAAKARGVRLGVNGQKLAAENRAAALARLAPIEGRLRDCQRAGLSMRGIAARLNEEGVPSPAGGRWHAANVHRALQRLAA